MFWTDVPAGVAADGAPASSQNAADSFKHIIFDLRGSRGGHGDVASSYLTALDLMRRHKYQGRMTFVIDEDSARILGKLMGRGIESGQSLFGNKVQVYSVDKIPANLPPGDLYMSLASPSGIERFSKDLKPAEMRRNGLGTVEYLPPSQVGIPITDRTVRITQTVLGNTENPLSRNPYGLLQIGDEKFSLTPAGLAAHESGIYYDPVALGLKGKTSDEVRTFVRSSLGHIKEAAAREMVRDVISKRTLLGSNIGLVYGITASQVKPQFEGYLRGLSQEAKTSKKSFTLLTPSGFKLNDVSDPNLRSMITVIEKGSPIPLRATPARIYVVKTGTLPHRTFVGLMALSEIPPVVAGDGALSAALGLGKPFAMTSVGWNERNIANMGVRLAEEGGDAASKLKDSFQTVYPMSGAPDLSQAQKLRGSSAAYKDLSAKIPSLTDSMLESARAALTAVSSDSEIERVISELNDPALRESIRKRSIRRTTDKRVAFREMIRNQPDELLRLIRENSDDLRTLMSSGLTEVMISEVASATDQKVIDGLAQVALELSKWDFDSNFLGGVSEELLVKIPDFTSSAGVNSLAALIRCVDDPDQPYVLQRSAEFMANINRKAQELLNLPQLDERTIRRLARQINSLRGMGIEISPEVMDIAKTKYSKYFQLPNLAPLGGAGSVASANLDFGHINLEIGNVNHSLANFKISDEFKKILEQAGKQDSSTLLKVEQKATPQTFLGKVKSKYDAIKLKFKPVGFASSGAPLEFKFDSNVGPLKGELPSGIEFKGVGQNQHIHIGSLNQPSGGTLLIKKKKYPVVMLPMEGKIPEADVDSIKKLLESLGPVGEMKDPHGGNMLLIEKLNFGFEFEPYGKPMKAAENPASSVSTYKQKVFGKEAVVIDGQVHLTYPAPEKPAQSRPAAGSHSTGAACALEIKKELWKSLMEGL